MTPSFIADAINHLLVQEPQLLQKTAAHAGKVALINAGLMDLRFGVNADGTVRPANTEETPAVSVMINASDLPLLLQNRERAFSYVRIDGDADFAHAISDLVQNLRWDAEADLSKLFGDIAAVRLTGAARSGIDAARSLHRSLAENVAEYLLEENPTLVRQEASRAFGDSVNVLRDDVERMTKRIEKLKARA